jgi:membrane-bound serine protease (ClpP class)
MARLDSFDARAAGNLLAVIAALSLAVAGAVPSKAQDAPLSDGETAEDRERADDERQVDNADAKPGLAALVRINLPVTSGADAALKLMLTRARDRLVEEARKAGDARRPTLVLEITPASHAQGAGAGSEFEPVLSLARLLTSREIADVKTVASLPRSIRGHGVLLAIACEEIVMAADAEIGEAGVDEDKQAVVSRTVVEAYREIADAKRTMPVAVAESMIDATVELHAVESEDGLRFVRKSELEKFERDHDVVKDEVLVAAGSLGRFTGREGRQYGFVKYLASDRRGLAQALSVPLAALDEDLSLLADWHPIMLEVKGEITPGSVSKFKTLLGTHLESGANWVGVRIDSVGGDLEACIDLATTLAALDPNSVRTVAYVPVEARGGAALVALACDQLAMHPEATLGAGLEAELPQPRDNRVLPPPGPGGRRRPQPPPLPAPRDRVVDLAAAVGSIRDSLTPRTERSWSLLAAMIDPAIEVIRYRYKATGEERLLSAQEVATLADAANWSRGAALAPGNEPLVFAGKQAVDLGLAWHTVDNFDHLKRLFGLEDIETIEPNWALDLVQALASPGLATFLLFLGFIGMYVELKTPGVGVGGVVAAVAFILFFWSKYLDQTAEALEIIMFVSGFVLMLIEVFVVPGFGIFGLAGGLMVIFSLVLASQTFVVPRSQADMDSLRRSITIVAAAGIGMIGLAFATRRYLPKAPIFNRMVLEPPPPEERVTLSSREALANYSHLIGQKGEAITDLRLAGKAMIGDELLDVISQAEPLDRGTAIVVVDAHANRVIVRRA